uniref:Uncharacterized protein n=1 Tax=Brassica oleracea TaxID=3712 RepID=A0A3P6BDV1_BRAOL|nr:unnamed protein product [Brassica oleracea]
MVFTTKVGLLVLRCKHHVNLRRNKSSLLLALAKTKIRLDRNISNMRFIGTQTQQS